MSRRAVTADSGTGKLIWPPVFGVGLVTAPAGGTDLDFSMFPGSVPPTEGTFIAIKNIGGGGRLFIFSAGMVPAQWYHVDLTTAV